MDFKNASLEELKQFVKEHKIKGVSALRKPALIEFLEKNYSDEADHAKENVLSVRCNVNGLSCRTILRVSLIEVV